MSGEKTKRGRPHNGRPFAYFNSKKSDFMSFDTIPARNIAKYSDSSKYMLIDVRNRDEYVRGHIPGAVNMPYENFDRMRKKLSRKMVYIFYCDRGATSLLAARRLYRDGYDVLSVIGGMHAYTGPLVTEAAWRDPDANSV